MEAVIVFRGIAFAALVWLAHRAGFFTLQVPETDTKWDVLLTFGAVLVLVVFVVVA